MENRNSIACLCHKCRGANSFQLRTIRNHLQNDIKQLEILNNSNSAAFQVQKAEYAECIQLNERSIQAEENKRKTKPRVRSALPSGSRSKLHATPERVCANEEFVDEMDVDIGVASDVLDNNNTDEINVEVDAEPGGNNDEISNNDYAYDTVEINVFDDSDSDIPEEIPDNLKHCQREDHSDIEPPDVDVDVDECSGSNNEETYDEYPNDGHSEEPLPDVVVKLREELRGGYTCSKDPPPYASRPHDLTEQERISLSHYIVWWNTNGTDLGYKQYAGLIARETGKTILSLHNVRQLAERLVDYRVVMIDMCLASCIAYSGSYAQLKHCPHESTKNGNPCMVTRYRDITGVSQQKPVPRAQFAVLPVMATIRALFANKTTANDMRYRDRYLKEALHLVGAASRYKDFPDSKVHATHYNHMGLFKDRRDIAFAFSSDGAQLTMKRQSNVWVAILILLNLPPHIRYKSSNVIITLVIPGPNSPQNLDSFLVPLFQEMARASEGIWVWDAVDSTFFMLRAYITMGLGDMPGSTKVSGMAGHSAVYGDRFVLVKGAKTSEKGSKRNYYPLQPPEAEKYNPERPNYNIDKLPLRNQKHYWETIQKLNNATTDVLRTRITQQTGISRLTICAASPAFRHPSFFPFDPFHLFYENCLPFFWDLWAKKTSKDEPGHVDKSYLQMIGENIPLAMTTLPPSFCGPVRDVFLKNQSQYKIYEWMALLHWYLVPMMLEFTDDSNLEVIRNFAEFVYIVEYAMTLVGRTETDLQNLHSKIAQFLTGFEKIYVNNDPKNISRCRLCVFQLIHIPAHIRWNGSVRLGSQATVERSIGELGHRVRSRKAPFANLTRLVKEKELIEILQLYYPQLTSFPARLNSTSSSRDSSSMPMFSRQPPSPKKKLWGNLAHNQLKAELSAIAKWLGSPGLLLDDYQRWGKLRLSNGYVLRSLLTEGPENPAKRHYRWFKARGPQMIFGEAYAFYNFTYQGENKSVVIYKPLREIEELFGVAIRGHWDKIDELHVLQISEISTIVGLWRVPNSNRVYVIQKHPGLEMLIQHMPDLAEAELETDKEPADEDI